jgi:hypothetical protein
MKISFNWNWKDKSRPLGFFLEECLSKEDAIKIKQLNIEKILLLDRRERVVIFSNLIGEEKATWLNSHFEKEFVLKNQKAGMLAWANSMDMKEKNRVEIIRKISLLENALTTAEQDEFIKDLADLALGIKITEEEEKMINTLCEKANAAQTRMEHGGSREEYEKAQALLDSYVEKLKNE